MVRGGSGFAEDELVRVAGPERAAGRPPQDHLLDLLGHLEVLVPDPAGRVGLELDPQLAPGDGQVGVVVGGLANVADSVNGHQGLRPAVGVVLAAEPALFQVPPGQAEFLDAGGHLGVRVDALFVLGHWRISEGPADCCIGPAEVADECGEGQAARRSGRSASGRGIATSRPASSDRCPYSSTDTTAAPAAPSDSGRAPVRTHSTKCRASATSGSVWSRVRACTPLCRMAMRWAVGAAGFTSNPRSWTSTLRSHGWASSNTTHFLEPYTLSSRTLAGSCQLTSTRATRPPGKRRVPPTTSATRGPPRLDEALPLAVDRLRPLAHEPDGHRDVVRGERPPHVLVGAKRAVV